MTIEDSKKKENIGRRIKYYMDGKRIFNGVFAYQFNDMDNSCFVKIDDCLVWWSVKDPAKIELI
jgi:hypothetical protein